MRLDQRKAWCLLRASTCTYVVNEMSCHSCAREDYRITIVPLVSGCSRNQAYVLLVRLKLARGIVLISRGQTRLERHLSEGKQHGSTL